MAKDSQGVDGMSGKLVTQPTLPGNATSDPQGFNLVTQAKSPGNTVTNRDSMPLVDSSCPPGPEPRGKARS